MVIMKRTAASRAAFFFGALSLLTLAGLPAMAQEGPVQASVEKIEQAAGGLTYVRLSVGTNLGVTEQDLFQLYSPSRVIRLPTTEFEVYKPYEPLATALVVDVYPDYCKALVSQGDEEKVKAGDPAYKVVGDGSGNQTSFVSHPARPARLPADLAGEWGGNPVEVSFRVINEPEEPYYVLWETTGGRLSWHRSSHPDTQAEVFWHAPRGAGAYSVKATLIDAAGNVHKKEIPIESKGPASLKNVYHWVGYLGDHKAAFTRVWDIDFDTADNAYVLDTEQQRVLKLDRNFRVVMATDQWEDYNFRRIRVVGSAVYLLDYRSYSVKRFSFAKTMFKQAPAQTFGAEGRGNGRVEDPVDFEVGPDGSVHILDRDGCAVQVFDSKGGFRLSYGIKTIDLPGRPGEFYAPVGIALGPKGERSYIVDFYRKKVLIFDKFHFVDEFLPGAATDEYVDIKADPFSDNIFVLDQSKGKVIGFTPDGAQLPNRVEFPKGGKGELFGNFIEPKHLRFDRRQQLYIVDGEYHTILHRTDPYERGGTFTGKWGGVRFPRSRIAAAPDGSVAMLDSSSKYVTVLDADGWVAAQFGGSGDAQGKFSSPIDVARDTGGDVYVLDSDKESVQRFTATGTLRSIYPNLKTPVDLTVDPVDGTKLWVLHEEGAKPVSFFQTNNTSVTKLPKTGTIEEPRTRIAGRDQMFWVFREDDEVWSGLLTGPGKDLTLPETIDTASDMEVSLDEYLFVVDSGDSLVRVFRTAGRLTLFGTIENDDEDHLESPYDVGVDHFGQVYVFDGENGRVSIYRLKK